MMHSDGRRRSGPVLVALAVVGATAGPAAAQESITWENSTELSFVSTGGNATASTLGLKGTVSGTKGPNKIKVEAGGIRSSMGVTTRTATGTPGNFTVTETTVSQVTAANYYARGRYDRKIDDAFLFAGAGWDRNTFAGIKNRYAFVAGIGRTLLDGEAGHLRADVGGTYTIQKDVDPTPGTSSGFGGVRMNFDALRHLSSSVDYSSGLILDENLADTQDVRADWTNSITVALSEKLAFKTSLELIFDNVPALQKVPLVDNGGTPTGSTVSAPGDKLDRVLTLTLVIKM